MVKRLSFWRTLTVAAAVLLAGIGAAVVAAGGRTGLLAGAAVAGPPIAGSLQDFTPIVPPRPAPEATFSDAGGAAVSLADLRGRVVLVNLWATWCAPCVAEMPSLDRLQAKLGGDRFAVVAISQDREGAAVVAPFYKKLGLAHLGIYLDPRNKLPRAVGAANLPSSFILDREGRLVGTLVGGADWDSPEALALIQYYLGQPGGAPAADLIKTGG